MQQANGAVEEYVASGTNSNGNIVLAHVHVVSFGTWIFQKDALEAATESYSSRNAALAAGIAQ